MNKQELISLLADKTGETKKCVEQVCNALAETIREELLNDNEIALAHVGKFKTQKTSARNGRNPRTGEAIQIPASKKVVFKVTKDLADVVKNKQ